VRLSSIFNFDTYQARWRVPLWLFFFLVFVIMVEVILRIPVVTDRLPDPEPLLWPAMPVTAKMEYFRAFETERGIDVLFVGNSAMQNGLNPEVFDSARSHNHESEPGSFNAAIEGFPPSAMLMFLKIYLRYSSPKTIFYGLLPVDLNDNNPWAREATDKVKHSPLVQAECKCSLRGHLIEALLEYSYLYRYREVLYRMLITGGQPPKVPPIAFDKRGYHSAMRRLSDISAEDREQFYNNAAVVGYSPEGAELESLQELITFVNDNDIDLILVNMPLADDFYNNFDSPKHYQSYLTIINDIASEFGIPVIDLENLPSPVGFEDQHFSDFTHLNRLGADKLSRLLAEMNSTLPEANITIETQ